MITCPKCFKENQDHYKFCLGCGAELPRDGSPKKFAPGTPPHGVPAVKAPPAIVDEVTSIGGTGPAPEPPRPRAKPAAGPMGTAVVPAASAAAPTAVVGTPADKTAERRSGSSASMAAVQPPIACPQCDHPNPANNKFCASCGFKLTRPAAPSAPPPAPAAAASSGIVLTALRADGTEAGTYPLPAGTSTIGRDTGAIFAGDSYLSPRHATFFQRGSRLFVHDDNSLNGVYKKLRRDDPVPINPGDIFRIGQEILRFELLTAMPATPDGVERLGSPSKGYIGRIALIIGRDASGNAYPVPEGGIHLGRERGDVLFPEDGYVSGLHCRLAPTGNQLYLTDLGSSNGTFVRIMAETEVGNGDVLLMGQQLFRIAM